MITSTYAGICRNMQEVQESAGISGIGFLYL
jgi:hypothetical protein